MLLSDNSSKSVPAAHKGLREEQTLLTPFFIVLGMPSIYFNRSEGNKRDIEGEGAR